MAARQLVFAVEQRCAYLDADGFDVCAWHLLGWQSDGARRELAAYLRLIDPGHRYAEPSIGRVLTSAGCRHTGLGRALMVEGMKRAEHAFPGQAIRISAQYRLEPFYASLNFRAVSACYEEDGIPHIEMLRAAPNAAARC